MCRLRVNNIWWRAEVLYTQCRRCLPIVFLTVTHRNDNRTIGNVSLKNALASTQMVFMPPLELQPCCVSPLHDYTVNEFQPKHFHRTHFFHDATGSRSVWRVDNFPLQQ